MAPRVLIVQHVECEAPGLADPPLRALGAELAFRSGHRGDTIPRDPEPWDGVLVLGGPMNADETSRYPFLAAERDLLTRAVETGVPALGICLGAQILARALGARVYRARRPEVGFCAVDILPSARTDALFRTFPNFLEVFQWHGDTFDLPRNAVPLASSPICPLQAFRSERAWGLQFHLEVTQAIARSWVETYRGDLARGLLRYNPRVPGEARQEARFARMAALAKPLFAAWAGLVGKRSRERAHS